MTLAMALLQGLGVLLVVCGAYLWSATWLSEADGRAFVFVTLVAGNLALIFSNRSLNRSLWTTLTQPNPTLWIVTGTTLALLTLTVYAPWLARLFQFDALTGPDFLLAFVLGSCSVLWFEAVKLSQKNPAGKRQ
jgi:Ca2+-transporting ATPase